MLLINKTMNILILKFSFDIILMHEYVRWFRVFLPYYLVPVFGALQEKAESSSKEKASSQDKAAIIHLKF